MKFLSLLAAVLPLASAAAVPLEGRAVPPALDGFYKPPAGFESEKPGTVLRERRIIASFFGLIPDPIDARQILYRTTALDGSAIATVTTVFKPLFAKKDRFIALNTAYDSSATICNPSYNYQLGSLQTDLISSAEFLVMQAYLASGYIVASSDYEGPEAAWTAGRLSGMGVLDGMRAVVNYGSKIGLSKNPMIVNTGYSGGSIAAGWAASLKNKYAPELNLKGWVMGGTPANLTETLTYVDGTLFSGFLPGALAGLSKPTAYGATFKPVLDKILTPLGQAALFAGNTLCVAANILAFPGQSIYDKAIQTLGPAVLSEPTIAKILSENVMGANKDETPDAPVFLYHAPDDEIIPYLSATGLRDRWCANGAGVHFTTYAAGGHATTEVIGVPDAIKFADDAFSGRVASGCTEKKELTDKLNPLALGLSLEPVLTGLINALITLGRKDVNWIHSIGDGKNLTLSS